MSCVGHCNIRVMFLSVVIWSLVLAFVPLGASTSYAAKRKASGYSADVSFEARKIYQKKTGKKIDNSALGNRLNLMVLGDSLGNGVWTGIYNAFHKNRSIKVSRKSKAATGFVRLDYYDWNAKLAEILLSTKIDIAVVMVGANDRQPIDDKRGRHKPGSKTWREIYAGRVDVYMKQLINHGAQVYWIGMPITRYRKSTAHMKMLNEVFLERARANNIKFVETWSKFVDSKGRYSAYGKDIKGRKRKLRANDGVHFTARGYRKLAESAMGGIRRDLAQFKLAHLKPSVKPKVRVAALLPAVKTPAVIVQTPAMFKAREKPQIISKVKIAALKPVAIVELLAPVLTTQSVMASSLDDVLSRREKMEKPDMDLQSPLVVDVIESPALKIASIKPVIAPAKPVVSNIKAKKVQKTEEKGDQSQFRQDLDKEFRDILSIVQPEKVVADPVRVASVPNQEAQISKTNTLSERKQSAGLAIVQVASVPEEGPMNAEVAPVNTRIVGPVSIESGKPDEFVEYKDEAVSGKIEIADLPKIASLAEIPSLGFNAAPDARVNSKTGLYSALLRGDALPSKIGRGDDFSWPRD